MIEALAYGTVLGLVLVVLLWPLVRDVHRTWFGSSCRRCGTWQSKPGVCDYCARHPLVKENPNDDQR